MNKGPRNGPGSRPQADSTLSGEGLEPQATTPAAPASAAAAAAPASAPAAAAPASAPFAPHIPASRQLPEFTLRALILGCLIGVIYGAANAYLGLVAGQTVSASLPAAVIGMFVLSTFFRSRNVLEQNIVQTIGSSGESLAAGVIFTVPALIFLGSRPSLALIFALSAVGGLLGMLFMIPLRRYLIVREHGKLRFPEGVACAEILKAGERGGAQFGSVLRGISVGALYRFVVEMFELWSREFTFTIQRLHQATFAGEGMPALLGVGMIVGPRVASLMFAGGFLGWVIILPLLHAYGSGSLNPLFADSVLSEMTPGEIWSRYLRYIGAGAVAVGGLMAVVRSAGLMVGAFATIVRDVRRRPSASEGAAVEAPLRTERDLSSSWLVIGSFAAILFLWGLLGIGNWRALVGVGSTVLLAFFFVAVAAYICGQVGSSASPVSGMTITALLVTCLVFLGIGWNGTSGMMAAMTVGAVICIAICMSGDMAQDLKTGFLLGATPARQQVANVAGNFAAAATIGFVIYFLHETRTIGSEELPAPQATLMSLIVQGLFGGNLPWTLVLIGMGIGAVSELLRVPTLPFAIGLYLPFSTSTAMFIGGGVAWLLGRKGGAGTASRIERGVLISSGLVAGDAIIGLLTIGLIEVAHVHWGVAPFLDGVRWQLYSLAVFLLLALWLYRAARGATRPLNR